MSRLIGFVLSFLIMVAITPYVFDKLMNSRLDSMVDDLRKEGIFIKEIKNKSSYLLTDRVFKVKLPLDDNIEAEGVVEVLFKNLPVTDVTFLSTIERIDKYEMNLHFIVTTDDFKSYDFKLVDGVIDNNLTKLRFKDIYGEISSNSKVDIGLIELENFKVYDTEFRFKLNRGNVDGNLSIYPVDIKDVKGNIEVEIDKKILKSNLKANLYSNKVFYNGKDLGDIVANLELNGLEYEMDLNLSKKLAIIFLVSNPQFKELFLNSDIKGDRVLIKIRGSN